METIIVNLGTVSLGPTTEWAGRLKWEKQGGMLVVVGGNHDPLTERGRNRVQGEGA